MINKQTKICLQKGCPNRNSDYQLNSHLKICREVFSLQISDIEMGVVLAFGLWLINYSSIFAQGDKLNARINHSRLSSMGPELHEHATFTLANLRKLIFQKGKNRKKKRESFV